MRYLIMILIAASLIIGAKSGFAESAGSKNMMPEEKTFNSISNTVLKEPKNIGLSGTQVDQIQVFISKAKSQIIDLDEKVKALDSEIQVLTFQTPYDIRGINMLVAQKIHFLDEKKNNIVIVINRIKSILTADQINKLNDITQKKGNI